MIQFIPYFIGFIYVFNFILAFTVIFLERRSATSTWAWLMVLFFIPIIGFILYLVFGRKLSRNRIFTWDTKSKLGVKQAVESQLQSIQKGEFTFNQPELIRYMDLYYMHLKHDGAIYTHGNDVTVFTDGKDKFDSLIEDLKTAKDHIHLLYYIYREDNLGRKIAHILMEKAKEGVEVRLLYDDLGSRRLSRKFIRKLKDAGVRVESFFPPKIPKVNLKINFRNHRKLAIIDGKIGYIGGFNIGDEYLGKSRKFGYWRDTHLRIYGDAVKNMQTRFILDWNHASSGELTYDDRYYIGG